MSPQPAAKPPASRLRLLLTGTALAVVAAGTIGALAITYYLRQGLPDYQGQARIPGLSAPVSVYRDSHGVPHIFATTDNDAARALGYTHAGERLFQMEMQRRAGQGRLSETIGSAMLDVDKFVRIMGFYRLAQTSYAAMTPQAQSYFQAYAAGVNAWLIEHNNHLPPEFTILHIKPEPWQPADSVVWGKLMALQLSHNYRLELLRAHLAQKLTPEQMQVIFPLMAIGTPLTTQPHAPQKTGNAQPDYIDKLAAITGLGHAASNEWVVSGALTNTGKPLLANDPHLGLEAPILWYLARIVTPMGSVKGATVPGLPIVLLGQNDHIAWGLTTTGSDVEDLFVETLADDPDKYLTPEGAELFIHRSEIIHIKDGNDVKLDVRATRHGPVLSDIDDDMRALAGQGKVMALAFTGLGDKDTTSEALLRLNHAHDWDEFKQALQLYQTPPQNLVYADTAGNIGFYNPGLVPVRKKGDGLTPVDGASGAYDWQGYVPFTELPQLYNPAAGLIFNANNALQWSGIYYYGVDWEESFRAERLQEIFAQPAQYTLDAMAHMQADHVSLAARQLLPYLLRVAPNNQRATDALALLKNWDAVMDKDRSEPLIFEAWLYQMHKHLLAGKAATDLKEKGPYNATAIGTILAANKTDWCGADGCDAFSAQMLDAALDMVAARQGGDMRGWRWGNEHHSVIENKLFDHIPVLRNIADITVPSSGDFYTLDRGGNFEADPARPFMRKHAGGYRGIYDLADPNRSRFMIATGQSGHILSPHYKDLVAAWNDVQSFTLSGTEADLAAQNLPKLTLVPVAR